MESYEPRRGGGSGIPDIQLLLKSQLIPVELKVGVERGGLVLIDEVRPEQVRWHSVFIEARGRSMFLVATPDAGGYFNVFAFNAEDVVQDWRTGIIIQPGDRVGRGPKSSHDFPNLMRKWISENLWH